MKLKKLKKRIKKLEKIIFSNQIILTSKENPEIQAIIRLEGSLLKTIKKVSSIEETMPEFLDLNGTGELL